MNLPDEGDDFRGTAGRVRRAVRSLFQRNRRRRGTGGVAQERLRDILRRRRG